MPFDPYAEWLKIDTDGAPLHYYSLLGLEEFCADPLRIAEAADERMALVRKHQLGSRAKLSQQVLNQLAAAKVTLISAESKQKYDEQLRGWLTAQQASAAAPTMPDSPAPTHALEEEASADSFGGFDQFDFSATATPAATPQPRTTSSAAKKRPRPQPVVSRQLSSFLNAYLVPMIWGSMFFIMAAVFVMLLMRSQGEGEKVVEREGSDADVSTQREVVLDRREVLKLPAGVALQRNDGDVMLEAVHATLGGSARLDGEYVTGLATPSDTVTWEFHIIEPGIFQPVVTYASSGSSGEFKLLAGPAKVWTKVHETGGWDSFTAREANKMMLIKPAGRHTITLSAAEASPGGLLNVQSILLKRNASGTSQRK